MSELSNSFEADY